MRSAVRRELAIPDDAVVFLTVGRITPAKGQSTVVQALLAATRQRQDLYAVFAGEPQNHDEAGKAYYRELQAFVADNGLGGHVIFAGFVEEIDRLYAAADVSVLPTHTEAFPRAITEAYAFGLPCIATCVGGIPEIVEHGRNGFLFEVDDNGALAGHMLELVAHPELRREFGERGQQWVADNLSPERHAEMVMSLYAAVLGRAGRC